jgi:hypothetical protein
MVLIRQNCFTTKGHEGFAKVHKVTFEVFNSNLHFYAKTSDLEGLSSKVVDRHGFKNLKGQMPIVDFPTNRDWARKLYNLDAKVKVK